MLFHNNFVTSEFDVYTIHLAKAVDDFRQAQQMLDGYTADFFGATIQRWDDMARQLWRQLWAGF